MVRGGYGFFYDRVNGNSLIHAVEQSPPYSLTLDNSGAALGYATLANPYPNQQLGWGDTRWVNFQTGASSNLNYPFMQENFVTPLVQSYNLNLQYQFVPPWVLEVGYVGSHGIHLVDSGREMNLAQLASLSNPINGVTTNTVDNATLRVPFLGFAPNGLQQSGSDGDMKYNSLQVTLRKQFSHGFQMQGAYTWARTFTNLQANGALTSGNGVNLDSNNPNDPRQQYGISTGYRPQRLVVNYTWDLPFRSQKGLAGKLLGGWNLSGVTTIQRTAPECPGHPWRLHLLRFQLHGSLLERAVAGANRSWNDQCERAVGRRGGSKVGRTQRRMWVLCLHLERSGGSHVVHRVYNHSDCRRDARCYRVGRHRFWQSGIGILTGPGQFNFDASLIKNTRVGGIHEDATLQFRAEFFNIFNHPQFQNPVSTDLSQANFGWITGTSVNPRLIQFALKYVF